MWQIIINGPGYFDTSYELPEGVTYLGRADENDIVLGGDLVSRRHARLVLEGDQLRVEDLGSRNGSRLNGTLFQGSADLRPGDTISLGENSVSVRQAQQSENVATEMVDLGAGGVRRFGHGDDVGPSVLLAKNIKDVDLLRALDNISTPWGDSSPPMAAAPLAPAPPTAAPQPQRGLAETLFLLFRTAETLATATNLTSFLESTMDRMLQRIDATTAVVLLRHSTGVLVPASVRHRGKLSQGEVPVSDAIIDEALRQGRALLVGDVRDDRRFASRESVILYGVDRVLCIPLGSEPTFAGVLYINTSARSDTELEVMLDACTAVAHLVSTGIQKFSAPASSSSGPPLRYHLERFHAPDVAERRATEALRSGSRPQGLEERTVSIVHVELASFGALSARLGPARASALLNDFHARLGGLVFSFEGALEGLLGESMRAIFGALQNRPDDAVHAVRAALALRSDWDRHMARRPADERCALRIGVNTAKVLVGMVGPDSRPSLCAVGEGVNVATWLAGSAEPGQLLVTGKTLAVTGARFDVVPLGERLLRPPRDKVAAFEVLDEDVGQLTNPGVR
ncbi:Adenylate cyclase [Cystobacter fuscus DSM 2262]|uniref:Adenylate cyclase n=1 Tax=Cystobacter fuscus (strain ATCC 25194 / DSM 2262 / NBRC 100088 / M29) TaxID=1242864 RepID=S9PEG5_CYSF2|nr:adenylate/guanylate cyclase domain-containing protein [Cystobacter fuscus]EPX61446.1 Adenylate cyclase [Cystobacter fuscus DSM 2262]